MNNDIISERIDIRHSKITFFSVLHFYFDVFGQKYGKFLEALAYLGGER